MTRVLLVRLSAMGDIVHSLGAARALAAARPDLELHYVAQTTFLPLFDDLEWLAGVIPHDRQAGVRGYLATGRRLRRLGADVAVDLQGNWKSAGLCRLSGAPLRVGAAKRLRREPTSRFLLNRLIEGAEPHPARLALALVRVLAPDAADLPPRLEARAAEVSREAGALRALGLDPECPFRVLVAGVSDDPRAWSAEAMLRQMELDDRPALWLAGPTEAHVAVPDGVRLLRHGPGELRRLIALGRLLADAGGDVIGPDFGSTHVLAAAGAPTRAMFGPQDPARTAPVGAEVLVRRGGPPCVPCRLRFCRHPDGPICMDFTTAEADTVQPAPG